MKKVLGFAAVAEAATGLALVVFPSLVVRLLFGVELTSVSLSIARVTGMALLGLGIACWPSCAPLCGMLTYSALATLYLGYIAVRGEWVGILVWPAVVLHAALTLFLAKAWLKPQENGSV
jgi:uncharacterized membrane protein YtjA (UPF0391 family)